MKLIILLVAFFSISLASAKEFKPVEQVYSIILNDITNCSFEFYQGKDVNCQTDIDDAAEFFISKKLIIDAIKAGKEKSLEAPTETVVETKKLIFEELVDEVNQQSSRIDTVGRG